jgi:alpha-glucuronidase
MAGSSILRRLCDADIEVLHHKLRRDAEPDLYIAKWVEARNIKLGQTDKAKINAISRYRKSAHYLRWLKNWENQDSQLKRDLSLQKQRFEFVSNLTGNAGEEGFENVSKHIIARGLALAAELSDADFKTAMESRGFVKSVADIAQTIAHDRYRQQLEALKKQLEAMAQKPRDGETAKSDLAAVVKQVDKIMGLA